MLCNKQMQQSSATNQLRSILPFLTFARVRASYSQTCSDTKRCGTPAQRKPERPVFQPRDQGEVFWNTTLLSIEQTSLLLLHEYEYKVSDITMNNIGTATLRHPQLLYASSRTTRSSGKTSSSGTSTTVMNSTPEGL